jgi:hypothetical protein
MNRSRRGGESGDPDSRVASGESRPREQRGIGGGNRELTTQSEAGEFPADTKLRKFAVAEIISDMRGMWAPILRSTEIIRMPGQHRLREAYFFEKNTFGIAMFLSLARNIGSNRIDLK